MINARSFLNHRLVILVVATSVLLVTGLGIRPGVAEAKKCPPAYHCWYEWRYTTKYNAPDRRGSWRNCVGFKKAKHKVAVTCQLAKSSSRKVTTSVSGQLMIPKGSLSAHIGYDVEHTTMVSASYTAYVPAHKKGKIQWAPVLVNRYSAQQNRWWCKQPSHTRVWKCYIQPTVYRFATTERYGYPTFRVVYNK